MKANSNEAMREALELMSDLFEKGVICTSYANAPEEMEQIEELYQMAKAALAAPPRNCERFKTKEEAAIAFAKETKQWIPQQVLWGLAPWLDWLFATATKGETDGSK